MKQLILKQFNNKKLLISSSFVLLLLCFCKKNEQLKNNQVVSSVKYKAFNMGVKLSKERQKKAFGTWKLTNVVYFDYTRGTSKTIKVDEYVTVNEQGVFNHENKIIANRYRTIGSYEFQNLDTLNTGKL